MSRYSEYFLKSSSSVVQLELIEISHPSFSRTFRFVRNCSSGVTATIDGEPEFFEYYPIKVELSGDSDDMDQTIQLSFGDVGEVLPTELDRVRQDDSFDTRPQLRYWVFRSDDMSEPIVGPFILQVEDVSFKKSGCTLSTSAQRLNTRRTGEIYTYSRFPMMKGFV